MTTEELLVLDLACRYVKARTLAIDGGCYIGDWTEELLRRFTGVAAFDAAADSLAACRQRNPKASIYHAGLWHERALLKVVSPVKRRTKTARQV